MLYGRLIAWVKLLADLQILGCELHKNAFGGTRWGSYSAPPDIPAVIREGKGGKWKKRVGNRDRRKGREVKDVKG